MFTILYEPVYVFNIADMRVKKSKHTFVPIKKVPQGIPQHEQKFVEEWSTCGESEKMVYITGVDVHLEQLELVDACGSVMCDSQHGYEKKCPALTEGAPRSIVLEAAINSDAANIHDVVFRSKKFTTYFLTQEAMEVSSVDIHRSEICGRMS